MSGLFAGSMALSYQYYNSRSESRYASAEEKLTLPYFAYALRNSPKYDKRFKGGEDSWVVGSDHRLLMVADGVGGWGELDVDPGLFSKRLSRNIGELHDSGANMTLKEILDEAVRRNPETGSSTAVMAKLEAGGIMKTCNLGDSGYLILRKNSDNLDKIYRSKEQ